MYTTARAHDVLRRHMLYISAPTLAEGGQSNGGGLPFSRQQLHFSRPVLLDTRHESVQHASRHLEAVERAGEALMAESLREALVVCCSAPRRLPPPQVTLMEFMRLAHTHLRPHGDADGSVAGEYILRAFSLFFAVDRAEAQHRYAAPLVELGVLLPFDADGRSSSRFDTTRFVCVAPYPAQPHFLPLRELLSRFVCLFCHQSCVEGGNELIYLSHSRWAFAPPPDPPPPDVPLDSPFSPFPETLRRGLLGPLMQFFTSFCVTDCHVREGRSDEACIVRLDGVKLALCQLTLSNISLLTMNPERGELDRFDCPVTLITGFPDELPDAHIRLTLRRMMDVVEMREGPRVDLSAHLEQSPEAFRRRCRAIGDAIFFMITDTFYDAAAPACAFAIRPDADLLPAPFPNYNSSTNHSASTSGVDSTITAAGIVHPFRGTSSVPRDTFSMAAQLLCLFSRSVGSTTNKGSIAAVQLVGTRVLLCDCHPYVASLLQTDALLDERCHDGDAQLPFGPMGDSIFGGCTVAPRLFVRTMRTASGAVLRLAWRYFGASLVRLMQPNEEVTGRFFCTVALSVADVQLILVLDNGAEGPTDSVAVWRHMIAAALQTLAASEAHMIALSRAVGMALLSNPSKSHTSLNWSLTMTSGGVSTSGVVPTAHSRGVSRMQGGGHAMCVCHDLTAGTVTPVMGPCDAPQGFVRDMDVIRSILGAPLSPPRRHVDVDDVPSFPFADLPVTRVLLGRAALGQRERTVVGGSTVIYGRRAGGEEYFFTPATNHGSSFGRVEEDFAAYMLAQDVEVAV